MNDTLIWILVAIAIVAGVVIGRMRRDPPLAIALDVAGYAVFLIGLYFASRIGRDAFTAAGAASFGVLLFTSAANLRRRTVPPG